MISASSKKRVTAPTRSSPTSRDAPSPNSTRPFLRRPRLRPARSRASCRGAVPETTCGQRSRRTRARERASAYISLSARSSRKEVASSKNASAGFRSASRANATRWRSPGETQLGAQSRLTSNARKRFFSPREFSKVAERHASPTSRSAASRSPRSPAARRASRTSSSSSSSSSSSFGVSGRLLESRESRESRRRSRREDSRAPGTSPGGAESRRRSACTSPGAGNIVRARGGGGGRPRATSRRFLGVFSREKSADSAAAREPSDERSFASDEHVSSDVFVSSDGSGSHSPATTRSSALFPHPLGPVMSTASPFFAVKFKSDHKGRRGGGRI